MKNLLLAIFICVFTSTAFAATALTKATAQQYFAAIKNLEQVQNQYPDIENSLDSALFADRSAFLKMLKSLPQYSVIEKAATSTGLHDVEQFYDLGMRLMGGLMAVQMDQMPPGLSVDDMLSAQEKSIEKMRSMQLPQAEIDQMLSQLAEQKQAMQGMLKLAQTASAEDKAFVKENMNWIMENMPEDDEQNDMNE